MAHDGQFVAPQTTPVLASDVERLLAEVDAQLGIPTAALHARFIEPLRIAVVGRTNAGKSTLVNALIGHRIAPTKATECTRVITWFRFGAQETARVVGHDGTARPLWLTDKGTLPDRLDVPHQQVQRIDVWRSYEPLRRVTVIDTPGLFGDEGLAEHTEQMLKDDAPDALLFVYSNALTDYEVDVIKKFRRRSRWLYDSPVNALGVLTRADQLGDQDHTWTNAQANAAQHSRERPGQLSGVLPVIGKIAETTESGRFDDTHAVWLRKLAAVSPDELEVGLSDADEFKELDCDVPAQGRDQLVDRLDMHGIRVMSRSATATTSAVQMSETLRAISGIAELRDRIATLFVRPATVHKTVRVLASLEQLAKDTELTAAQRGWLANAIGAIRSSAPMHTLDELKALAALHSGRCRMHDEDRQRAIRIFSETEPRARLDARTDGAAALAAAAAEAEGRWTAIANSAIDPQVGMVASTAAWSAALMHQTWSRT
jgi:hypothetical protein